MPDHPERSVNMMKISEATLELSKIFAEHLARTCPTDPALGFLTSVGRIVEFRENGDLSGWETAVLETFNDAEWQDFENRPDFPILESIWDVGRMNLFGTIDRSRTEQMYVRAAKLVQSCTGTSTPERASINFGKW